MTSAEPLADMLAFFKACFGETRGVLHAAIGRRPYRDGDHHKFRSWIQRHYQFPDDAEHAASELVCHATLHDVFVCPYLMGGFDRTKGSAVARRLIHADVDDGQLDIEQVRALGGFAVASGTPGNGHVYVPLATSVDTRLHTELCRGLAIYLGSTDMKIADNDLLRPPGTHNFKPTPSGGAPLPVQWALRPDAAGVSVTVLAALLGVPLEEVPRRRSAKGLVAEGNLAYAVKLRTVRAALAHESGDRSEDTMRIVAACHDEGLSLGQTRAVVQSRPDLAARIADRGDDDIQNCWSKVAGDSDVSPDKRAVSAQLLDLARDMYGLGISEDGTPFGFLPNTPHVALSLRGGRGSLRTTLAARFFDENGVVPGQQALTDAVAVLEGLAARNAPCRVNLRVAKHGNSVYVDMADDADRVVAIEGGGWALTNEAPVVFRRTELTGAVPEPARDGDLRRMWSFINVVEADRPIVLAFLIAALIQPDVPHAILGLLAEHGSAKSASTRWMVSLIDPSPVALHMPPKDFDGWIMGSVGSWVVALDNLSKVPDWLSDALCRAATGASHVRRRLYTDSDLTVFTIRRCVIINGIDLGGLQGDLTDRLVTAELARIGEEQRRDETELESEWQDALPTILGGLLDLAAKVHERLGSIIVERLPRMADYAKVLACIDEICGTNGLARYRDQATHLLTDSLQSDPFISTLILRNYICDKKAATQIQADLLLGVDRATQGWPRRSREVTVRLNRHAPALRALGWRVDNDKGRNKRKTLLWTIAPPALGGADSEAAGEDDVSAPRRGSAPNCEDRSAGNAGQELEPSPVHSSAPFSAVHREEGRGEGAADPPDPPRSKGQVGADFGGGSGASANPSAAPPTSACTDERSTESPRK